MSADAEHTTRLSLLVVTFNRPRDLRDLLVSVLGQSDLDEVLEETLILDNGTSVDYSETWAFARERANELKLTIVRSDVNLGVAGGRNVLIRRARAERLLIVDDDVVFPAATDLAELSRVFDKEIFRTGNTAIVQPRVVYYDTKQIQRSAFAHKRRDPSDVDGPFLTSFFAGAAHLIRKSTLADSGLYPDDFFYGMEEYDLSYRLIEAGYTIGYDPTVTVEHKEAASGRLHDRAKLRAQWLNKTRVAWRYLPVRYAITTAILWSGEYVRRAKSPVSLDYLRGWIDVLRVPFVEQRAALSGRSRHYLRSVDARLWY